MKAVLKCQILEAGEENFAYLQLVINRMLFIMELNSGNP